ncbi:MAG: chloride channel protein [Coriobacteriales bacterium]
MRADGSGRGEGGDACDRAPTPPARRAASLCCWLLLSALVGTVSGLAALALSLAVRGVGSLVSSWHWAVLGLPALGLATFALYRRLGVSWDLSTNSVIASARSGSPVPLRLAPAIFAGTLLSLLGGASVGKEGAALQMGGSLGSALGERALVRARGLLCDVGGIDRGVFARMGMAGAFASLMSAPVSATFFVLEVTCAPVRTVATPLVLVAAVMGWLTSAISGVRPPWLSLASSVPVVTSVGASVTVAMTCTVAALAFCMLLRLLRGVHLRGFPTWSRVAIGGVAVVLLTCLLGPNAQVGTGEALMAQAFTGQAPAWSFAVKMALTLLVLASGFKGGEIMPAMSIGAALGCQVGTLLGVDPAASAGVGLVAMLAGCTNAPIAAALLGVEAFGPSLAHLYALVALASYLLSFYTGLYPANFVGGFRALAASLRLRLARPSSPSGRARP